MRRSNFFPFFIFLLVCLIYAGPLFKNINNWGQMDWDQWTFLNAVPHETILRYHQFPLWSPYGNGGNVALAHPHSPFLSPFYIFVLLFGPIIGLKIQIVVHLLIGMFGMFLLAKHFNLTRYASYLPPLVYMLNSTYTLHLTEGHLEWLSMAFVPWLFLYILKSIRNFKYAIGSIIFLCLMILAGSVDVLTVVIMLLFVYALFAGLKQKKIRPLKLLIFIFIGTLLLSGIKLIPMLEFINENPRQAAAKDTTEVSLLADIFLSRDQELYYQNTKWANPVQKISFRERKFEYGWHEYGAYVGYVVLFLAIIGFIFYFRRYWPLILSGIVLLWISLGAAAFYNLWGLLHKLPIYDSLHVPSRFILGFTFCLALFSGLGLSKFENIIQRKRYKFLIGALVGFIFFDLFLVDYPLLGDIFIITPHKAQRHSDFKQRYRDFSSFSGESRSFMYPIMLSNSGVINSYEIIGVEKGNVKAVGDFDYRGEAYFLRKDNKVKSIFFSPNRIKVNVQVKSRDTLVLNQNFYTGWKARIDGNNYEVCPFDGLISVDLLPGEQDVLFYYLPKSFIIGLVVSLLSLIILMFWLLSPVVRHGKEKLGKQ